MINNNAQDRVTRLPLVHASGLSASPSPSKEKPSLLQALGPLSLLLPSLVSTFLIISFAADGGMPGRYRPAKCWRGPRGWLWQARAPASVHDVLSMPTVHPSRRAWLPTRGPLARPRPPTPWPRRASVACAARRCATPMSGQTGLCWTWSHSPHSTGPEGGSRRVASAGTFRVVFGLPVTATLSDGNPRARSPCKVTEGAQARTHSKAGTGKGHVWGRIVRG